MRSVIVSIALVLAAAAAGCKGETVYKDNPDTAAKLDSLQKQLEAEKQKAIDDLAACQRDKGAPAEITFTFEGGDVMKLSPGKHGTGGGFVDDATTAKESQAFLDQVQKSRGAIQKCYEVALKKNASLQARTVSMKLSAKFSSAGDFSGSSNNPSLGDVFDTCLRTVASRWKMPAAPAPMTFEANVSLSPT